VNFSGTAPCYVVGNSNSSKSEETIRPWYSDFTIADRGDGGAAFNMYSYVTFCTDDENGVGRTITVNAVTRGDAGPAIIVSGSGRLQVNRTAVNREEPPVAVTDTATLAFGANGSLGTGGIALCAGTTLELTATGNAFTAIANPLALPEEGAATLRIGGAKLRSGDHVVASSVAETAAEHLVLDAESPSLDGRKATLRVDRGNLVLSIEPSAAMHAMAE